MTVAPRRWMERRSWLLVSGIVCSVSLGCSVELVGSGGGVPGPDVDVGDDDDADDLRDPGATLDCPSAAQTVLRGTVTLPNGELPVHGALVYVPAGSDDGVDRVGECAECIDTGSLLAHTTTAADGSFELRGLPAGPVTLVVDKGRFHKASSVDVAECEDNLAPAEATRLPRSAAEGRLPRLAAVTGHFDHMEDVLAKIGVDASAVDLFAGEYDPYFPEPLDGNEPASALLQSPDRLRQYDIVFVDCGGLAFEGRLASDATVRTNVREFVEAGGRLYVTDLAYDLAEGAFPPFVDYSGGGAGLDGSPEQAGSAGMGQDRVSLGATVEDDALGEWLEATGEPAGDEITVRGLITGWAMVDGVDGERTRVWVSGQAPEQGRPLTLTFEAGCGRTLFTSYHTLEENRAGEGLSAQEKILAYLVLEIGTCITEPELY